MTDSPKIDLVLADLEKEIAKPEAFVVVLSKNKRITFKDPYDFRLSEREEILDLYQQSQRQGDDMKLLSKLLSEDDYAKYKAEDLPIRTHSLLMERVMTHFEGSLGESGEGNASAS